MDYVHRCFAIFSVMNSKILRFLIREMLLREGPLDFIGGYSDPDDSGDPDDSDDSEPHPSIAYGKSNSPVFRQDAEVIMKNVPDGWSIITLSNVRRARTIIKSESFKNWLLQQGIPRSSRVIVIEGEPFEGDFSSSEWAIFHDIIGHSISNRMGDLGGGYDWRDLAEYVHKILPRHLRLGSHGDTLPDVCGAIFTGQVKREDVLPAVQEYVATRNAEVPKENEEIVSEAQDITELLFKRVEDWKDSIPPGKPTLISQF